MSHAEYIATCDEEQLVHLVELANTKLKQLREAGWVKLWVVSDDYMNLGWFYLTDYAAALQFLTETGLNLAAQGKPRQLGIRSSKFRPEEAEKLVMETQAEIKLTVQPASTGKEPDLLTASGDAKGVPK